MLVFLRHASFYVDLANGCQKIGQSLEPYARFVAPREFLRVNGRRGAKSRTLRSNAGVGKKDCKSVIHSSFYV